MNSILVRGDGVAASCCARLLKEAGLPVRRESRDRPRIPAIMLGANSQSLLADIFDRPDLFRGTPRISRRCVLWGEGSEIAMLPHEALVISEDDLLARLQEELPLPERSLPHSWTIHASKPLPEEAREVHFGSRTAVAASVVLRDPATETCWMESLASGWLFLIPKNGGGSLLAVGGEPEELLRNSRLVNRQIASIEQIEARFPSHARVADPLGGLGWVACGTAALAFDPLCGDGTAYAAREAILASALLGAITAGENTEAALAHYRSRLLAGLLRHLEASREFYRTGGDGEWWREQAAELDKGIAWCHSQSIFDGPPRFRLQGYELIAL